jgi:hypothetical protein
MLTAWLFVAEMLFSVMFRWSRFWDVFALVGATAVIVGMGLSSTVDDKPPKQRDEIATQSVTFVLAGLLVLIGGMAVRWALPVPRFIRPYDAGYEYQPLARPTADLTRAIQTQPRWKALQSVRHFSFAVGLGPNGNYTVRGTIRTRHGAKVSFYTRRSQVVQTESWMRAFPHLHRDLRQTPAATAWGTTLAFEVQRLDGRYGFYLERGHHERAMLSYGRSFLHGVLVTMSRALVIHQRDTAAADRRAHRIRSWGGRSLWNL